MLEKVKSYFRKLLEGLKTEQGTFLAMVLFFPLGLFLMWKYQRNWNQKVKIVTSIVCLILFFTMISKNHSIQGKAEQVDTLSGALNMSEDKLQLVTNDYEIATNQLDNITEEYASYKEKMEPYEALSEADAKKKEADLKAAEEKRVKEKEEAERKEAERVKKEEEDKKAKEAEQARIKAEEEAKQARIRAEAEAKGYETGITFEQLARTPDDFEGKKVKFYGKVIQVMEDDNSVEIRVAVNDDYDSVIYGAYDKSLVSSRVLEDDYITMSGESKGLLTYKSTMGGNITVPSIIIKKIEQ